MNRMNFLNVEMPEDIKFYINAGYFDKARNLIDIYLKRNISTLLKERFEFEVLRMRMLERSYIYSFNKALELCMKRVRDFTKEELQYLIDERYADWIFINGEIKLSRSFLSNTIKVSSNIKERLFEKEPYDFSQELRKKTVDEIIHTGSSSYYFHLKTGLRVNLDEMVKGNIIKAHIPVPTEAQQINNIHIIKTSPVAHTISPTSHPQRTVYFEKALEAENEFIVEYSYENHITYNKLDYDNVGTKQPNFYTNEEKPHIKFSTFLIELAKEIVNKETNPLKKARAIYDYITTNVQYSYVRKYAAIESIAEYCAYNLKGDCGLQALLFITLCRICGIPAKWQSGLYVNPYYIGCHDWAEFYVEPYGWLFADPSFGGGARRNNDIVGWNFYFGNLDPFRMVANEEFQHPLYPEKSFLRNDPYDNQVGEVETDEMNLNEYVDEILEIVEAHKI